MFAVGFGLGAVRVLVVAPRLGETAAVTLEVPPILAASWLVCRWCVERGRVPRLVTTRCVMGAVAFAVLIAAEFVLGHVAFGRSVEQQLAGYASLAGAVGLAAQLAFAALPLAQLGTR